MNAAISKDEKLDVVIHNRTEEEAMRTLATVRSFSPWVLVDEKMPEEGREVLVTMRSESNVRYVTVGTLRYGKWMLPGAFPDDEAIAWMKMPISYWEG